MDIAASVDAKAKLAIKCNITVANMLFWISNNVKFALLFPTHYVNVLSHTKNAIIYTQVKSALIIEAKGDKKFQAAADSSTNTLTLDNAKHCRACTAVASVNIHSQITAAS